MEQVRSRQQGHFALLDELRRELTASRGDVREPAAAPAR
jgi:hypothetical protein